MGRGQGDADELFYGDTIAALPLPPKRTEEEERAFSIIRRITPMLAETPRHYDTLEPDPDGSLLLGKNRFFPVFDEPAADNYDECFVVGLLQGEEGQPLVAVNTYETWGTGDFLENLYTGTSVEKAALYSTRWAGREGRGPDYSVAAEQIISALEVIERKLQGHS